MGDVRTRRITILLNEDEGVLWDAVRNRTVPEGVAARVMFLQSIRFLVERGSKQRRDVHVNPDGLKRGSSGAEHDSVEYDYSDSQG